MPDTTPTPTEVRAEGPLAFETEQQHRVDLRLTDAPDLTFDTVTVTPIGVRITYLLTVHDEYETVRIDGRNRHGHLDYYTLSSQNRPAWLAALVEEHRPADRAAGVRAAAIREVADAVVAFTGSEHDANAKMLCRLAIRPAPTTTTTPEEH